MTFQQYDFYLSSDPSLTVYFTKLRQQGFLLVNITCTKFLIHAEKMKRMPDHPMHQKLKDPTKNRLKRKSLNHLVKEQQKEHADILTTDGHLCEKLISNSWPPQTLYAEIRTTIPGITTKENQSEAVLRSLALEEIDKHYPAATWTHIYTDGSAENATRNGGCGAYIKRPDKLHYLCQHLVGYCAQTIELKP